MAYCAMNARQEHKNVIHPFKDKLKTVLNLEEWQEV